MPRRFVRILLASSLLFLAKLLVAQPTTGLTRKTGAATEPFSNIVSVQELPDGRVVVTDARERALSIVDFARGDTRQLGRNGSGPNEYTSAQHLFRGRGDTLLLFDFPARRMLRVAPNGTLAGVRTIDMTVADTLPGEKPMLDRLALGARASDSAGGLYYEVGWMEIGKGMRPDRLIARWDPATRTSKRVAAVRAWYPERSSRWNAPFMYQDLWVVAPDGRVARVVPVDYHVEWYRDGALVSRGATVAFPPVRVTKADRDAWYRAHASQSQGSSQIVGPPPPPGANNKQPVRIPRPPGTTDADFPDVKPPFVEDYVGRSAMISGEGELWVTRAGAYGATTSTIDVFDAAGALVRHVSIPATHRVGGFGKGVVYLVRTDDDGLQWLERYER